MTKRVSIFTFMLFFLLAASCAPEVQTPSVPINTLQSPLDVTPDPGYPVSGYPIAENNEGSGYPVKDNTQDFVEGPEFTINTPITTSDMIVAGTGPAGVPIKLVNVSRVGLILGETIIDPEGSFIFSLNNPLESGHLIGIQLGDIEGTDFNESDFIYSETYYERPFVGILFDMVLVQD